VTFNEEQLEMRRFHRNFAILAALAMVATLVTGSIARADIIVTFQETGDSPTGPLLVASGSPIGGLTYSNNTTETVNDFAIVNASLTELQTGLESVSLASNLYITNNAGTAKTITATVQYTGYTLPTAPPGIALVESIGGTNTPGGSGSAGQAISFSSTVGGAPAAPTLSPAITSAGGYSATGLQGIAAGVPAPFSVLQSFTITLNPGTLLQVTGSTSLTSVPEPASVAMALTGLPIIGLLWARRRRRA
jgi:hypothetical protein